jgi:hypothetical protein
VVVGGAGGCVCGGGALLSVDTKVVYEIAKKWLQQGEVHGHACAFVSSTVSTAGWLVT